MSEVSHSERLTTVYNFNSRNGAGWRKFPTVRLMLSIGNENHTGEKFKAAVDWVNRHAANDNSEGSIKQVILSVNDSLQRYNLLIDGVAPDLAEKSSRKGGDEWLNAHAEVISHIAPSVTVRRWNDYLRHPDYPKYRKKITQAIRSEPGFSQAIEEDVNIFYDRKFGQEKSTDTGHAERFRHYSRLYIMEELAVFAMLTQNEPAAEIYPGSNLKSAEYWLKREQNDNPLPELSNRRFFRFDCRRLAGAGPS